MFIFLDKSLAYDHVFKANKVAFVNIAQAARDGRHIIAGDFKIMNYLARKDLLGLETIYRTIANSQISSPKSIQDQLEVYVKIISGDEERLEVSGDNRIIILGISKFENPSLSGKTILLGEDLSDAMVYKKIAETYAKEKKLRIQISCTGQPGGGNKTASVFDTIQKSRDEPRFCICVVDNDMTSPFSKLGDTAKKLKDIHYVEDKPSSFNIQKHQNQRQTTGSSLCDIHIIGVRDIENLLFLEIIHGISNQINCSEKLNFFDQIYNQCRRYRYRNKHDIFILKYADIREGTTLGKALDRKGEEYEFWVGYANQLHQKVDLSRTFINHDCLRGEKCIASKLSECTCFITPPLGKILNALCKFFENNPKSTFTDLMEGSPCIGNPTNLELGREWEIVGKKVASWCCAMQAIRTSPKIRN